MKIDISKWLFKNRNITNKTVLTINNDNIPYEEINKNDKIAFIICTQDQETIKKCLESIIKVQQDHQDKEFTVFISSSYNKLHKLTNGTL